MRRHSPLDLGPLPTELINRHLDHDLEEGNAHFSINAQKHAAMKHPDDYGRLLPHIAQVIAAPTYLGDDFKNLGNIEMVGHVPALKEHILVAVEIELDDEGRYNVTSFYPVGRKKVENRLATQHLVRVIK